MGPFARPGPPGERATPDHVEAFSLMGRTWQDEAKVLSAVDGLWLDTSKLHRLRRFAIVVRGEGVVFSDLCGDDKLVDTLFLKALTRGLAGLTQVRRTALPPLPLDWPANHSDGRAFLQALVRLVDRRVLQPNWTAYGGLFAALGIPKDAMLRWAERVPAMSRRPYNLLHGDLRRANVIVPYDPDLPLAFTGWELASYGDPLYDLANHLVRMRYPAHQWEEVVDAWQEAMKVVRPAAVNGLHRDLPHFIGFVQALSVHQDVMRVARSLQDESAAPDQKSLDNAKQEVRRALEGAKDTLGLAGIPDEQEIEQILFRWRAARSGNLDPWSHIVWSPDLRFHERPDFPSADVDKALRAEGAASADRVFKGTGHLNTVVHVPGAEHSTVVVRRKLPSARRRERGFLSEHGVLRAIEQSRVDVAAPRSLALGTSYQGEPFAIHTYVGPQDTARPPNHPVQGLLPHEADALVDQLCALTEVGWNTLDPAAGQMSFYTSLSEQLIQLVAGLPKECRQLAQHLGLPAAPRLGEILARHQVTDRKPTLLHGDLNPWNLVRRPDKQALTIIDWEMAVVGDPLYDLVRHMHLTPTKPEIRDRLFSRWKRRLADEYTSDWERDWGVYRWIEIVRSAYIDLDRLVTGVSLDAPNVRRALDSYAMTLAAATASLGLPARRTTGPCLARALG